MGRSNGRKRQDICAKKHPLDQAGPAAGLIGGEIRSKSPAALLRSPRGEEGHAIGSRLGAPARTVDERMSQRRLTYLSWSRSPQEHTCMLPFSSIQTIKGPFPMAWPILCIIFTILASVGIALVVAWPSLPKIVTWPCCANAGAQIRPSRAAPQSNLAITFVPSCYGGPMAPPQLHPPPPALPFPPPR